ncbi:LMBR1-like membrane protein-domain-containing protein [Cryomyces antarcticus]
MASSSIGSDVFALMAILAISVIVLLLLRYYLPLRTTPAYLLVPVFLALALPSSIILLVPIDLASSAGTDTGGSRGIWLPERAILVTWRICYWLTFALTWAILPLLGEYSDAGYREPKDRFFYALRSNGRYQLITLGSGLLGGVYIFLQSGFHGTSVKGLVMALAYAWGLILAIYLMGHGLVALPRKLLRNASISDRLRRLQSHAPKVHDKLNEAIDELEQLEMQVMQLRQRKNGVTREFSDWIQELAETSELPESRGATAPAARISRTTIPAVITERYLADLTRKLKRARHKKARFIEEWDRLVQKAADTQAVLDSSASKKLECGKASPYGSFYDKLIILTPYTRYILHTHITPALHYALGSILAVASICIIWSEVVKSADPKLSIVGLTVVHHPSSDRGQIGFAGQVIAAAWLMYMCTAALFSVTEVKVWGNRALVKRQTYSESACWYALQVAKLTVPLSYNFITFVSPTIYQETAFYKFLGKLINLTPLGKGFSSFFPIFILVPVCATLFNLYGKVKNVVGFGVLEDEEDGNPSGFGTGGWREGKALIERELHGSNNALHLANRDADAPAERPAQSTDRRGPRRIGGDRPRQPLATAEDGASEEDDGSRSFYQDFAQRVRNTFDTAERPEWIAGIGEGFKRPKWMGGDDDRGGGSSGGGGGLGRWFGGRSDGRVRL